MLKSVFLTGVGGQGVVTIANLLSAHLQDSGYKVTLIHATGMAQRGGRVTSEIRYSDDRDRPFGPRISSGGADYIIGMDMAETVNSASFLKAGGTLVFQNYTLLPSTAVLNKESFPDAEEVKRVFAPFTGNLVEVEPSVRPVNMFVLGVFARYWPEAERLEETLSKKLTKRVEENLTAFHRGRDYRTEA
ncbi:MAG: 2-oxoacid:acceptor oxidoreductase family protein [Spirochaetales bacterium]|nr:2-oxoacid:acceptor oxidoreductase family protein [Spirochaetales bacterium]